MSNDQPRTDTSTYKMNHTMVRVKDPKRSVKFYEDNFGMSLINKLDNPDAKFCLYFLAFDSPEADSYGKVWTDREGLLELTHNYGTEDDPSYKVNNGNDDPEHQGFGHIAISVNNITRTCEELAAAGVQFKKPLSKDRSLDACREDIVYALDPDGYYIALIQLSIAASEAPQRPKWRFSHTMLRVKDMEASTHFYASYLGMATLYRTKNQGKADFEQAFMGYQRPEDGQNSLDAILNREGVVELVQYRGTEKQDNVNYHNGNDQPQGFGHVCISVDDLDLACARFGIMEGVRWKKRLTDGRMKNVAFLLDPDGYWVEVLQNEALKKRANW
ncbi:lactoylglutathione lyase-like protein [Tirmania nivea]|nr:lactoylglutathione lyase-like protein [Tirmania nivea]